MAEGAAHDAGGEESRFDHDYIEVPHGGDRFALSAFGADFPEFDAEFTERVAEMIVTVAREARADPSILRVPVGREAARIRKEFGFPREGDDELLKQRVSGDDAAT